MNCNPDGSRLTTDDLTRIALDHGVVTSDELSEMIAHEQHKFEGALSWVTKEARFALFLAGELNLDTRPTIRVDADDPPWDLRADVVAYVTRKGGAR